MASESAAPVRRRAASVLGAPVVLLAVACATLAGILTLDLTLPIGPFYWDLFIYFDAANRILDGQMPAVDFFTPVGPLGYWLFTLFARLFPEGQPLLVAQWSMLAVAAPAFALVLADVDKRSRGTAIALLVPFLVFAVLPFNVERYSSYPGADGFAIYNRQGSILLYVLTAGLVFCQGRRSLVAVVAATLLALFLTKVTGFLAGGMLCAFAFAAGRIAWKAAAAAAAAFFLGLVLLEASSGVVGAYLADIALLVGLNEGDLLPRFLQAASIHFIVFGPAAVLCIVLAFLARREIVSDVRQLVRTPSAGQLSAVLDRDAFWLGTALFASLFFETQNTGGQGFIFIWPVLLTVLVRTPWRGNTTLVLALVAATSMPTFMEVVQRAARAFVGQVRYTTLGSEHLKTLGAVSQKPEIVERSERMIETYRRFPETYQFLSNRKQLPTFTLYAEPDFQLAWLKSVGEAVAAIRQHEAATGQRFETIMNLNFVNPFPWLLDRHAPLHVAIGADPFRAVPPPDENVLDAVRGTDLVLYPKCPITIANDTLLRLYQPALTAHRRVVLSPCWDAFVRQGMTARP